MAPRQRDGMPIVCGRDGCGALLCRALPAESGEAVAVVLVDVRQPAQLMPATEAGPVVRWRLICRRRVITDRKTRRCMSERTLRVDRGALVDLVRDPDGRQRLVLGVDV